MPVAQLDRVSASGAEGKGFKSLQARHLYYHNRNFFAGISASCGEGSRILSGSEESSSKRNPLGAMSLLKSLQRNFGSEHMEFEKIFLPFDTKTQEGDVIIASPVYAFEALISESRKLSPTKFFRRIITVDAVNGYSQFTKLTKFPKPVLLEQDLEYYMLEPQITSDTARFIAEQATVTYEERSFGTLLMNWKIYPEYITEKRMYQGYIIRGESFIDALNSYGVITEKTKTLLQNLRKNR